MIKKMQMIGSVAARLVVAAWVVAAVAVVKAREAFSFSCGGRGRGGGGAYTIELKSPERFATLTQNLGVLLVTRALRFI